MTALTLILLVASAGYALARATRLPIIPLLLVAGSALAALGWVERTPFVDDTFRLALTFLVFSAGMELNPDRFARHLKTVFWVGLTQFLGVAMAGFAIAGLLGFDVVSATYLGIALSTSSTLVVVQHLKQQQQMFEPFGRLVLGVLLVQDLLMILIIVVAGHWPQGVLAALGGVGATAALAGVAVGCQRWLMPWFLRRCRPDEETLLLTVLALLFAFMGAAVKLGISPIAGAFLAGFALARFPVNGIARGQLLSFNDFFQAIFFTALGGIITIPDGWLVAQALLFSAVVWGLTPPLVALVAEWRGLTARPALEAGLLLAQTSELALVLGLTGAQMLGHIPGRVFSLIALVAVLTMTLTPLVARDRVTTFLLRFHPLRRRRSAETPPRDHALMLGFGAGGMWVLKPLRQAGHTVVVVDDDPAVITKLQHAGVPCVRGDGADEAVLERAGARQARVILAAMRRVEDAERVLRHAAGRPVLVRVFEEREAAAVRRLGGIPILNSIASADTFMEWFEKAMGPTASPNSAA